MDDTGRLKQQLEEHLETLSLWNEKISRLARRQAIEIDAAALFKLEIELKEAKKQRHQLEQEIDALEAQLAGRLTKALPLDHHPTLFTIPFPRNPFFTGREELLARLHAQLQSSQPVALSQRQAINGLGGIGKTQIAVEYAYRFRAQYQAILWTNAASIEALNASYVELATRLNLPEKGEKEQAVIVQAVCIWLQNHQNWLLILDNADEPELLTPFLPTDSSGSILLTTRATALRQHGIAIPIAVETFSPEQGALFLLHRSGLLLPDAPLEQAEQKEKEVAVQIVNELGGLPLALDQAGAYLESTGTSLAGYLQRYQQARARLLQDRRGKAHDHPEPVATTWDLSFQRVEERNPAAAELLRFCAFLDPDSIGEELITEGAKHLGTILAPIAADPYLLDQAIEVLRAYSLIKREPRLKALSVHRLVQSVVRDALPSETATQWKLCAITVIKTIFPSTDVEQWELCERYLPHALLCAQWIEETSSASSDATYLLNQTGYYLNQRGLSALAEPLYLRALAIHERVLGPDHPDTALSLNNLAYLYDIQGLYAQAEPLYQRALAIYERVLGPDHPDTARSLNNLAVLYRVQGLYAQAEPLYQRALAIYERVLGPDHPDTARSLNNLAYLYNTQGLYALAEPLYQRALAIYERVLGPDHPDTARSLNNLAVLYDTQGLYALAEPLYQRALAIYEHVLGPDHPDTLTIRANYRALIQRKNNKDSI